MIQCWEYEVEIQKLMKVHSCYTTCDNAEVALQHSVVVFLCQLRHINHSSNNIATSIIGGRRWHGI